LYKLQLEYAQKEIFKAQEILDSLEVQRRDAESSAANARNVARKLREDSLVDLAREEGRRLGLQEGLTHGRRLASEQARSTTDRRDSRSVPNDPSQADEREDDVRSFPRTRTPAVLEQSLDPIGETMLNFPSSPPAVTSPNRVVLSHTDPEPLSPPRGDIRPILVHNTLSPPHHLETIVPPEGFIPRAENDSTIRLPPPHEMARTVSPTEPTLIRQASMESGRSEPLMIRNPDTRHEIVLSEPESPSSTTISQFEIVSEPNGSISRQSRKKRRSLSVIPEVVSAENTPAGNPRSISRDSGSRPASSPSVSHGTVSLQLSL
jgi:hypothetical protein